MVVRHPPVCQGVLMQNPVRSLGLQTDLMVRAFRGHIDVTPERVAVRTPSNPTFRWGNYLVLPRAPQSGDMPHWIAMFREAVGGPPQIEHLAFTWDAPDGEEAVSYTHQMCIRDRCGGCADRRCQRGSSCDATEREVASSHARKASGHT